MNTNLTIFLVAFFASMIVLTTFKIVHGEHINALLDEDEAIICLKNTNENSQYFGTESCKYIDILDLLTEKQERQLYKEYGENYDIDTFPFGVATK